MLDGLAKYMQAAMELMLHFSSPTDDAGDEYANEPVPLDQLYETVTEQHAGERDHPWPSPCQRV
jgi:hypothetical protein